MVLNLNCYYLYLIQFSYILNTTFKSFTSSSFGESPRRDHTGLLVAPTSQKQLNRNLIEIAQILNYTQNRFDYKVTKAMIWDFNCSGGLLKKKLNVFYMFYFLRNPMNH